MKIRFTSAFERTSRKTQSLKRSDLVNSQGRKRVGAESSVADEARLPASAIGNRD
jgi:hypothetical protein